MRRAPSAPLAGIDIDAALAACRPLWAANQEDPRLNYLLGRLLWSTDDRNNLGLDVLYEAAITNYAAAFDSLAGYLEVWPGSGAANANDMHLTLRAAFSQRVASQTFDAVYDYLAPLAQTPRHREGLRWLAIRGAALGSPEAHLAVADLPGMSMEDWAYHLEVAAGLLKNDDPERAEEIRALIPRQYYVDASDRAQEYSVERPIAVPAELIDAVRATN